MSRIFRIVIVTFALIDIALVGSEALSARYVAASAVLPCDVKHLVRAGRLTYTAGNDIWVSARGQVFRIQDCPALKEMEMDGEL